MLTAIRTRSRDCRFQPRMEYGSRSQTGFRIPCLPAQPLRAVWKRHPGHGPRQARARSRRLSREEHIPGTGLRARRSRAGKRTAVYRGRGWSPLRSESEAEVLNVPRCPNPRKRRPHALPSSRFSSLRADAFQVTERARLQFRWEVFNLPNTPSFGGPNATLDTNTVGRVTSTSTAPRQMQVALKLTF